MISLDIKTKSSLPTESLLQTTGKGTKLSFSELLKGVSLDKSHTKELVQNGLLVLSLNEKLKSSNLSENTSILPISTKDKTVKKELSSLELNPELTSALTPKELRVVINNAKSYLKNKIINNSDFKKSEIEALPKTLKGLVQIAKKLNINISKITIEDITPIKKDVQVAKTPLQPEIQKNVQVVKQQTTKQQTTKVQTAKVQTIKIPLQPEIQKNVQKDIQVVEDVRIQTKVQTTIEVKKIKTTLLFKAQVNNEITTQQLVNTKLNSTNNVTSTKRKNTQTLKTLLSGDKVAKINTNLTADFSVNSAKVVAPSINTDNKKPLDFLLSDTKQNDSKKSKTDGLNINKVDNFNVKLNEAKQMIKYISQDVKTAIQDYKAPFTRIKLQLHPQKLGEIDLTVVQRGKNLHINLSSNNVAVNTLTTNINDLKVQLNNSGINNASFNFNNNSQSSDSNAKHQQQNHQNEHQTKEETKEEVFNSLEIVVPNYA